jgi:hypothetical protein
MAVLGNAGKLLIFTFIAPGFHGPMGTGMQGMGVSTPNAAAVADATMGFAREEHMPNGKILTNGTKSMMVAANILLAMTGVPLGITIKELGATPNEHCNIAPIQTCCGMNHSLIYVPKPKIQMSIQG